MWLNPDQTATKRLEQSDLGKPNGHEPVKETRVPECGIHTAVSPETSSRATAMNGRRLDTDSKYS